MIENFVTFVPFVVNVLFSSLRSFDFAQDRPLRLDSYVQYANPIPHPVAAGER